MSTPPPSSCRTTSARTRRVEEWKYSDLAQALGEAGFGVRPCPRQGSVGAVAGSGVEFFDLDEPNRPAWVRDHYGKLKQNSVSAVSLALARGGIALRVPKNKAVADPWPSLSPARAMCRALIVLEEGASLTLVEFRRRRDTRNIGVEIMLGANAQLDHVRLAPAAGRGAGGRSGDDIGGGRPLPRPLRQLSAPNCRAWNWIFRWMAKALEAHLSGVSVLGDDAHADITTRIIHAVGNTQ